MLYGKQADRQRNFNAATQQDIKSTSTFQLIVWSFDSQTQFNYCTVGGSDNEVRYASQRG